jgi:hypothetical protein
MRKTFRSEKARNDSQMNESPVEETGEHIQVPVESEAMSVDRGLEQVQDGRD